MRICVVIPYFDNPRTISQVVKDVVLSTPFPILLVDDGSETPVSHALYSFEVKQALESGRVRVVRFEKWQGKGAALQYAMGDLIAQGYTHMMTLDGDGLHLARELNKLVEEGRRHPWALILGNRGLKASQGGRWKRWLNRLIEYSVSFETGSHIQDPRSGFRLYPLFALQMQRFRTKHYDFDLEVLIRLIWNRVEVREIAVETAVFDPREHVTHFHRFWDSLRLSLLNLVLMVLSLLKTHNNPRELSLAASLGVFLGCTPLFGFHTVLAAALAVVLRLNFVAIWLGTHVSTPIIWPLILWLEVYIGSHWLHIDAAPGMMGHFGQLAAGSVVLGALLAIPTAAVTYWGARTMQTDGKTAQTGWPPARGLSLVVRYFGMKAGYIWAPVTSLWRYLMNAPARRGLNEFYIVIRPGLSYWARQICVFRHLRAGVELQVDALAGAGRQQSPMASVGGDVVLTGCFGRWDLVRGQMADRADCARTELFPFLGKLVPLDVSGFAAAFERHQTVTTVFAVKEADGDVNIQARPARDVTLRRDAAVELQLYEWGSRFALQYEFLVRRYPEQWQNFYPFFSSAPLGAVDGRLLEDLQSPQRLRPQTGEINGNT